MKMKQLLMFLILSTIILNCGEVEVTDKTRDKNNLLKESEEPEALAVVGTSNISPVVKRSGPGGNPHECVWMKVDQINFRIPKSLVSKFQGNGLWFWLVNPNGRNWSDPFHVKGKNADAAASDVREGKGCNCPFGVETKTHRSAIGQLDAHFCKIPSGYYGARVTYYTNWQTGETTAIELYKSTENILEVKTTGTTTWYAYHGALCHVSSYTEGFGTTGQNYRWRLKKQ